VPDITVVFDVRGISGGEDLRNRIGSVMCPNPEHWIATHTTDTFLGINVLKPFSFVPNQPFLQGDDCLFVDGTLYDNRSTVELLRIILSRDPYKLRTLNGQFNAVILNSTRDELTVITDRLGFRPIYYAVADTRHVVSSEIKGLSAALGRSFDPDPLGLIELFAFGHNIDDRTLLDGVRVLPPGVVITIDANGMQQSTYDKLEYQESLSVASPRDCGEQISQCIKTIMPKYLKGPARKGIFLSGGLDSRIVAGAIGQSGHGMSAYTFGELESRDVLFAREIASRMGFSHEVFPFPPNYLSEMIEGVVERSECATPFYHASSMLFHDAIAQKTDAIVVGFCGDNLSGGHLSRAILKSSSQAEVAQEIFKRALCVDCVSIARIFNPDFFKKYWREMTRAFNASVNSIDQAQGPDIADVWDIRNRQRRFTFSAPKVDRGRFEVIAPLLDRDFVGLMTGLPLHMRWKQLAYRHAIVEGFPDLRAVPWAKTGRPIPSGNAAFWADEGRRLGAKVCNLGFSKLGIGVGLSRDRYRNIAEDMRRDHSLFSDHLYPRVADGSLPEEIFDLHGIREIINDHINGKDYSHLLGTIMTVALYLEF
jgi:asparagine synthetase B (glutamine-hydrolysing)